jgi:hypothetical protein
MKPDPNEYKTVCDRCFQKTWYEIEQPCKRSHEDGEHCSLGHWHGNGKTVPCGGTLRVIDYTNVRTHLQKGERYTFIDKEGNKKRFTLGATNGWKPVLLLLHNARSHGSSITINAPDIKWQPENQAYFVPTYF